MIPEMVREVVFWCAVLVVVVSGAVLIGQMEPVWQFPPPAVHSATVVQPDESRQ
jgi:hypothetical protein